MLGHPLGRHAVVEDVQRQEHRRQPQLPVGPVRAGSQGLGLAVKAVPGAQHQADVLALGVQPVLG